MVAMAIHPYRRVIASFVMPAGAGAVDALTVHQEYICNEREFAFEALSALIRYCPD
jgi:hypothetical protein